MPLRHERCLLVREPDTNDSTQIDECATLVGDCQPYRAGLYGHTNASDDHASDGVRMHECGRGGDCAE